MHCVAHIRKLNVSIAVIQIFYWNERGTCDYYEERLRRRKIPRHWRTTSSDELLYVCPTPGHCAAGCGRCIGTNNDPGAGSRATVDSDMVGRTNRLQRTGGRVLQPELQSSGIEEQYVAELRRESESIQSQHGQADDGAHGRSCRLQIRTRRRPGDGDLSCDGARRTRSL